MFIRSLEVVIALGGSDSGVAHTKEVAPHLHHREYSDVNMNKLKIYLALF